MSDDPDDKVRAAKIRADYTLCPPASQQEREAARCAGKHRFTNPTLARRVASRSAHSNGERMTAYRCHDCGGWHIGSNMHKKRKRH